VGGATAASTLGSIYRPTLSLQGQVEDKFIPYYGKPTTAFNWTQENTLFASMLGMNDIGFVYTDPNATAILAAGVREYGTRLDELYQAGARNFLIINVPPTNRAPLNTKRKPRFQKLLLQQVTAYNNNLRAMTNNLSATYSDVTAFYFDFNGMFNKALDNKCAYEQTCVYQNMTNYCTAYEDGTASWYTYLPECGIAVDKYFWLNGVHPTFRFMNATAQAIATQLSASVKPGSKKAGSA
jgi:phospholipase/lecithinase/hemolysin